jgi:short-subunit dehydrogenase
VEIEGSRVLLTGASGGLGRAIARELYGRGAHVIVTARRDAVLAEIVAELGGDRVEALPADLASAADVAALPERAGRVDIFVHNAALPASGRLESYTPEQIDRALDVNLRAGIQLTRALMPAMAKRRGGHLVYVSSMSGKVPVVRSSIYAATKYGLRGFAASLRDDLHGSGVGVSAIFPGPIKGGGMWDDAGVELPRWVPTRTPDDVAEAVARAIVKNKPEIDVADPVQKMGAWMAALMPGPAARVRRLMPVEDLADKTAAAQLDKR